MFGPRVVGRNVQTLLQHDYLVRLLDHVVLVETALLVKLVLAEGHRLHGSRLREHHVSHGPVELLVELPFVVSVRVGAVQ